MTFDVYSPRWRSGFDGLMVSRWRWNEWVNELVGWRVEGLVGYRFWVDEAMGLLPPQPQQLNIQIFF